MQHPASVQSDTTPAPPLNLALQGGGTHGAFTWGVLDALLEDGRITIEGISGTSAGAMNAVALADGFANALSNGGDPRERARSALADFWEGVIQMGSLTQAQRSAFDIVFGGSGLLASPAASWLSSLATEWTHTLSPYEINPLDINPLRDFLEQHIDFDRLHRVKGVKVFVVATRVATGQAEVFSGKRLTAKAVMASACLPMAFQAVEIEGQHYWDGGYSGNPALHPLIYSCDARDVMLVQINPMKIDTLPTTSAQIMDRISEITFNASLLAEMRAIDFVKRQLNEGHLDPTRYKDVLLHRIDGGDLLKSYSSESKISTSAALIHELRDLGINAAKQWLHRKYHALGVQSTVNIRREYLDDLRLPSAP